MVATSPGLRERKKRQTRLELHRAAVRLVLRNGLEHVTVEEMSAAAGYAPRTFFNHFPTKEAALIIEFSTKLGEVLADLPDRIEPEGLVDTLVDALLRHTYEEPIEIDDLKAHHELMERHPELVPQQLRAFETAERGIVELLRQRTGGGSSWPHVEVAASLIAALMRVAFQRWISEEGDRPLHELLRTAIDTARELTHR